MVSRSRREAARGETPGSLRSAEASAANRPGCKGVAEIQIDRRGSSCASMGYDFDSAALRKVRMVLHADDFAVRDRQRGFGENAPVKPAAPADANRLHRPHPGDCLDCGFKPSAIKRRAKRELIG